MSGAPSMPAIDANSHTYGDSQMTRGQQTVWIVGTLLFLGAGALFMVAQQDDPNDPYAECYNWLGDKDTACAAEIARQRIRGF